MTIGIGFHCKDGIVLAADQQQTMQGFYKVHSGKIGNLICGGTTLLWTYSYLPNLVNVMRDGVFSKLSSLQAPLEMENVTEAISRQITEMKNQYPTEMEQQQFLFAASCRSGVRFIRVTGGIVDEPAWACIGIGDSSVVNFISKTFTFAPPTITETGEALVLALYIVYLAKQFVDGVGGPTDAVILPYGGGSTPVFILPHTIKHFEERFEYMHFFFRDLYNILTNSGISDENSERLLKNFVHGVRNIRKKR